MTPDEHAIEAERLLALAEDESRLDVEAMLIARAQVHATLATRTVSVSVPSRSTPMPPPRASGPPIRADAYNRPRRPAGHVPTNEAVTFDPDRPELMEDPGITPGQGAGRTYRKALPDPPDVRGSGDQSGPDDDGL